MKWHGLWKKLPWRRQQALFYKALELCRRWALQRKTENTKTLEYG